jgi:hypothetical protein
MPTFGQVTTVIQSALSKVTKTQTLPPGSIPSDVKMSVNAINHRHQNERYEPPHRRNVDSSNPTNSGKFSLEKATFYCGKGHTESLKEQYGYNCHYCKELDHRYSDCDLYWQGVCHGRVAAPPQNHDDRSKFVPPARQANHQPRSNPTAPPH